MKASVYKKYGLPEVLQIKEVEKPIPKENELLIRLKAATVNRSDCAMLTGKPFIMRMTCGLQKPKKTILGTDFSGEVVETGSSVSAFQAGDKVFGFDDGGLCSHAQFMTMDEMDAIENMPDGITFEEAAASIEGAHYAINFINKVDLQKGDRVLVNGASGAIGSALVQLLKYYGAYVAAVANTKNMELMKSLGADDVIDYQKEDFTKTAGRYHYVFDAVGKSSFGKCKVLLEPAGTYISSELGKGAQNPFLALTTPLLGGKKVRFPFPFDRKGSVRLMKKIMEEGKFTPVIDRTYPLDKTAEAFTYVLSGEKTGNVVLKIDD